MDLVNNFSWSFSRDSLFKQCQRAYYYNYYGYWLGWDKKADQSCKDAYRLKNITGLDLLVGDVVHKTIKHVLTVYKTSGTIIEFDAAFNIALDKFSTAYTKSQNQDWQVKIKDNTNLFEHYYGINISDDKLHQKIGKIEQCLVNFYRLDFFNSVNTDDIFSIDTLNSFFFEEFTLWAALDLVIKKGDAYYIYDWKTGKQNDKDLFQLSLYIYHIVNDFGADIENIYICPVYLLDNDLTKFNYLKLSQDFDFQAMYDRISNSANQMISLLFNFEHNALDINNTQKTKESKQCNWCKFKELCLTK